MTHLVKQTVIYYNIIKNTADLKYSVEFKTEQ